jgi:phytoene dehydrogenase-like protein
MKKIVIIGAGISGMSAGIYARKAGFETEIYESHTIAGGNCTGWNKDGYQIDGCIEWLTGSKKGTGLHNVWKTCGALTDDTRIYYPDTLASTIYEGKIYHLYADMKRTKREFLSISPEDSGLIKNLVKYSRLFQGMEMPVGKPFEQLRLFDVLPLIWRALIVGRPDKNVLKFTISEYISTFKSPVIRQLLSCIVPTKLPSIVLFFALGTRTSGDGGIPEGGSLKFAQRMRTRFEELGGKIHLGERVTEIIIKDGVATGIKLEKNGTEITADYVIPALDIHAVMHQLLGNKYRDEHFELRYANPARYVVPKATYVAVGVNADLRGYPHFIHIRPANPLHINTTEIKDFGALIYNHDIVPGKEGKTVMTTVLTDEEFEFWKNLKQKSEQEYKAKKSEIAQWISDCITDTFPELKGKIEMTDVATPLTFNRYCNSYHGAYMAFIQSGNAKQSFHKGTIDGIENLYLAGQWVLPNGGLPIAVIAGKFAVQRICKKERIKIK